MDTYMRLLEETIRIGKEKLDANGNPRLNFLDEGQSEQLDYVIVQVRGRSSGGEELGLVCVAIECRYVLGFVMTYPFSTGD